MGGLDLGAAAIVIQNGFGVSKRNRGAERGPDGFGAGLLPRELSLRFVHPFGSAFVPAFFR